MCSSGTSSPSAELTFLYLMRAIVRSSSLLNETPCLRTAWKSLIGIATRPTLIVPFQTGRGIPPSCPIRDAAHTHERRDCGQWGLGSQPSCSPTPAELAAFAPLRRSAGEDGAGDEVGAEGGEDRQVEQSGGSHH